MSQMLIAIYSANSGAGQNSSSILITGPRQHVYIHQMHIFSLNVYGSIITKSSIIVVSPRLVQYTLNS